MTIQFYSPAPLVCNVVAGSTTKVIIKVYYFSGSGNMVQNQQLGISLIVQTGRTVGDAVPTTNSILKYPSEQATSVQHLPNVVQTTMLGRCCNNVACSLGCLAIYLYFFVLKTGNL